MKDPTLSREEASDALDRAGKIEVETEERLRVEDVVEAGAEVGISPESVRKGINQAIREQKAKAAARASLVARAKAFARGFVSMLVGIIFIGLLLRATLEDRFNDVVDARTRVHEAIQRQAEVRSMTRDEAELLGAENRISIARRRYDRAARAYNNNNMFAPRFGRPDRVPYSNEITNW